MAQRQATQHGGEPNPLDDTGLCLLSLDGGGVRGLSTLYILKSLMAKLAYERYGDAVKAFDAVEKWVLAHQKEDGADGASKEGRGEMGSVLSSKRE